MRISRLVVLLCFLLSSAGLYADVLLTDAQYQELDGTLNQLQQVLEEQQTTIEDLQKQNNELQTQSDNKQIQLNEQQETIEELQSSYKKQKIFSWLEHILTIVASTLVGMLIGGLIL